jgi:hypothetical protein
MKKILNAETLTYTLAGLSKDEYDALKKVLEAANDSCFGEQNDDDCQWYSSADLMCTLESGQREALHTVCEALQARPEVLWCKQEVL